MAAMATVHARASTGPDQQEIPLRSGKRLKRGALNSDGFHDYGSKRWCENQLIVAASMALQGRPARSSPSNPQPMIPRNPALAVTAIMALAKLKGYIVEKRQSLAGRVDLNKLAPAELKATLEATLDQLSPGERSRIMEIASADVEDITDADPVE